MFHDLNSSDFLIQRRHPESSEKGLCSRAPFQRDRDRILHSRAFRRLMHKTQIFNANKGDHYRNRLTHTLEVSQIARSIGKVLHLNDELIEAIALGHDLGHTPFGHIGERTLNDILSGNTNDTYLKNLPKTPLGFKHNFQSLRMVDELETRCPYYKGINLTLAVREGMLKHTKLKRNDIFVPYPENDYLHMNLDLPFSFTYEGQVVAIADEIAQATHDLEDAVRSKIVSFDEIRENSLIQEIINKKNISFQKNSLSPSYEVRTLIIKNMVGFFIENVCVTSQDNITKYNNKYHPTYSSQDDCIKEKCISLSNDIEQAREKLYKEVIEKNVLSSEEISISDSKSEYIISHLFKAYHAHPKQLPDYVLKRYYDQKGREFVRTNINDDELKNDLIFIRAICDHIAGMTDQFAAREYNRLYLPEYI